MASDLNKVLLMGRLTADPELRRIGNGTAVTELRIASNRSYQAKDGEKKEDVLYADVTVWDKGAEIACQFLRKGSRVFVEGSLKLETWQDKNTGEKRQKIKIQADPFGVTFLDSPKQDGGQQQGYDNQRQQTQGQYESRGGPPQGRGPAPAPQGRAPSGGGGGYAGQGRAAPMTQAEVDADDDVPFAIPYAFNEVDYFNFSGLEEGR